MTVVKQLEPRNNSFPTGYILRRTTTYSKMPSDSERPKMHLGEAPRPGNLGETFESELTFSPTTQGPQGPYNPHMHLSSTGVMLNSQSNLHSNGGFVSEPMVWIGLQLAKLQVIVPAPPQVACKFIGIALCDA